MSFWTPKMSRMHCRSAANRNGGKGEFLSVGITNQWQSVERFPSIGAAGSERSIGQPIAVCETGRNERNRNVVVMVYFVCIVRQIDSLVSTLCSFSLRSEFSVYTFVQITYNLFGHFRSNIFLVNRRTKWVEKSYHLDGTEPAHRRAHTRTPLPMKRALRVLFSQITFNFDSFEFHLFRFSVSQSRFSRQYRSLEWE